MSQLDQTWIRFVCRRIWSSDNLSTEKREQQFCACVLQAMHLFSVSARWRWWRGKWGRTLAILLWLHYALPDGFLEGPLRFCPTHWVLEWLGLLLCVHFPHWHSDSRDRGLGLSFRLHRRPQRLSHCCGVRGPRHLCSRWACVLSITTRIELVSSGVCPCSRNSCLGRLVSPQPPCAVRGILSRALEH